MKQNKEELLHEIQDILNYISLQKKEQDSLNNQYRELSKNFTPIKYRKPTLLEHIFPRKYYRFLKSYAKSQKTEKELEDLSHNSFLLQVDIEELECVLFKLQGDLSEYNPSTNDTKHNISKNKPERDVTLE